MPPRSPSFLPLCRRSWRGAVLPITFSSLCHSPIACAIPRLPALSPFSSLPRIIPTFPFPSRVCGGGGALGVVRCWRSSGEKADADGASQSRDALGAHGETTRGRARVDVARRCLRSSRAEADVRWWGRWRLAGEKAVASLSLEDMARVVASPRPQCQWTGLRGHRRGVGDCDSVVRVAGRRGAPPLPRTPIPPISSLVAGWDVLPESYLLIPVVCRNEYICFARPQSVVPPALSIAVALAP
ncbi:hypothetical protein C8J57DRAFT_1537568 [Mycena rebaudengoi]|nr:hypothetical protein C8J57DRAFT_1537568 [Mycena rebaudengoi]